MNVSSESESDKDSEEFQIANRTMYGEKGRSLPRSPAKASAKNQTSDNFDLLSDRQKHKSGWRYTFSSLSNPGFFFLWLSMITMMAGMQMQMLAGVILSTI